MQLFVLKELYHGKEKKFNLIFSVCYRFQAVKRQTDSIQNLEFLI